MLKRPTTEGAEKSGPGDRLACIGALQFGAMCFFYTRSFGTLRAHEAALATILTPLYVVLFDDFLERRLRLPYLGYFLWSVGARKVNAAVLGVMNDLKIPLAVLVAILLFGERAAWCRLAIGGAIMGLAWWRASRTASHADSLLASCPSCKS